MAKLLIDNAFEIEVSEGSEATIHVSGGEVTVQIKEQKLGITVEENRKFMKYYAESVRERHENMVWHDKNWFQRLLERLGF